MSDRADTPGRTGRTGRLVGALLRRETRPARLLAAALVVAGMAAALGRHLAARGLGVGAAAALRTPLPALDAAAIAGAPLPSPADVALALLARLVVPAFAIAAAWLVVDRVATDDEAGWLPSLAAAGGRRTRVVYALVVPAAVLATLAPLAPLASAALALGAGEGPGAALRLARGALPGAAAFVLSCAAYATIVALLVRRRRPALATAAIGVAAPLAALVWWQGAASAPPAVALVRLISLHVPPLAWDGDAHTLARHALYAAAALAVVALLAPRTVARDR